MVPPVLLILISVACKTTSGNPSFTVDYNGNTFLKDGVPFRYISGTIHYFQVPHYLWKDRMIRTRAMGVNAIQTYIDWSKHETYENRFNFNASANVTEFLEIAKNLDLLVVLRPGPYIDAEQDFGGLPYWLLKYPNITLRSSQDPRYLRAVENWFSVLLPMIRPYLYSNAGPVIMVQVENEYGSYGCDKNYTTWLYNSMQQYLQDPVVYFTTDGREHKMLSCGSVNGTLTTIDFGVANDSEVEIYFQLLRQYLPQGPLVNSEFYPGWQDEWWQTSRSLQASGPVAQTMASMWLRNASFNIYPIHGGTNWGYQAGSEYPPFKSITTEYDFDAPISEAGDITLKFEYLKVTIEMLTNQTVDYPLPSNSTKFKSGFIPLQYLGTIFDFLLTVTTSVEQFSYPPTMEQMDLPYGFAIYQSKISRTGRCLSVANAYDRAYVMINYQLIQVIQRGYNDNITIICPENGLHAGAILHILIENQGRTCYGQYINDPKGLLSNITVDNKYVISNWTVYPLDLPRISTIISQKKFPLTGRCLSAKNSNYLPSFYAGYLNTDTIGDTFLNTTGWVKGQLFINDYNIGRYWPVAGPQMSLYVPMGYLKNATSNQIFMFELDGSGNCDENNLCYVNFSDYPIYSAKT